MKRLNIEKSRELLFDDISMVLSGVVVAAKRSGEVAVVNEWLRLSK